MIVTTLATATQLLKENGYTLDLSKLARRERIATAVLGGLMSSVQRGAANRAHIDALSNVQAAVTLADVLINEIDK